MVAPGGGVAEGVVTATVLLGVASTVCPVEARTRGVEVGVEPGRGVLVGVALRGVAVAGRGVAVALGPAVD